MKMVKGEVVLNMAAEKAWEMYRSMKPLTISKINPEMLFGAEYIQGDGAPGSLRLFKLGPSVSNYVKEFMEKIEKVETGRSVTYEVIGVDMKDMYDAYRVTFSFVPVEGSDNKCIAEWRAEFESSAPATPPPGKARGAALRFLKSFDNFKPSYKAHN